MENINTTFVANRNMGENLLPNEDNVNWRIKLVKTSIGVTVSFFTMALLGCGALLLSNNRTLSERMINPVPTTAIISASIITNTFIMGCSAFSIMGAATAYYLNSLEN